jgi:hypothetical protein
MQDPVDKHVQVNDGQAPRWYTRDNLFRYLLVDVFISWMQCFERYCSNHQRPR